MENQKKVKLTYLELAGVEKLLCPKSLPAMLQRLKTILFSVKVPVWMDKLDVGSWSMINF